MDVPNPPGPYDSAVDEDPWFLPPAGDEGDLPLFPTPSATLIDATAWRQAEAQLSTEMAELAFDAGRLAERVQRGGAGALHRLALEEAASLSWWTGDRIGMDRLALWLSYRIGATEEDGGGLIRTAWAARRLMALARRGLGDAIAEVLDGLVDLTTVTRGCAAFHLWRSLEERPEHLRDLEAAVLGARQSGQGGLPFLPLALTGFGALTGQGPPERRLASWVQGSHRAVLAALMTLERLAGWRTRAEAATADLSGRTPARLIAALAARPMLGAAEAAAETGSSRAAVQRNLDALTARGLVREVTGRGRFRVWAAKI